MMFELNEFIFYCLHMSSRKDRHKLLAAELDKLGVGIDRVKFIEGVRPNCNKRYKRIGTFGCAIGHWNMIKQSMKDGIEKCLFIEDDVKFLEGFEEHFKNIFHNLNKNQEKYDVVFFKKQRSNSGTQVDNYIRGRCRFVSAECYFMTLKARELVLKNSNWWFNGKPIDMWMNSRLKAIKSAQNYTTQHRTKSDNCR